MIEIFFYDVFNSRSLQEWCLKNLNQVTFNFNNNFINKKNPISFLYCIREIYFANVYIISQFIKSNDRLTSLVDILTSLFKYIDTR
jgi:hypothetical protein